MERGFINVIKVKYSFQDGNEVAGLELNLAPKVKKFIHINKDNAQLLKIMNNGLIDWYNRAEFGDDIMLTCNTSPDLVVGSSEDGQIPVNFV